MKEKQKKQLYSFADGRNYDQKQFILKLGLK